MEERIAKLEKEVASKFRNEITLTDGTRVPADDFWLYAPTWLVLKHAEPI